MPSQVERKQTPIGPVAFAKGIIEAWKSLYGNVPSKETIGVLWGQYMIETGGKSIWNYNIGNVKHVSGDGYNWFDLPGTWEIVNGQKVVLPEGSAGRLFRAYDSFGHAFKSHLKFLEKRYSRGWEALKDGDPVEFVHDIKAGRDGIVGTNDDYFTGDLETYTNIVVGNFKKFTGGTYFDDAVKDLGVTASSVGKASPPESVPVSPEEPSHLESGKHTGGTRGVVDWAIVHKSPFDDDK